MREAIRIGPEEAMELKKFQRIQTKLKNKELLTDEELLFILPQEEATMLKSAKLRETELNKENTEYQRKVSYRRNSTQINQLDREKTFKQGQIDSGELLEVDERFMDKKKPKFFLENEIDQITLKIEELEEQNKKLIVEME